MTDSAGAVIVNPNAVDPTLQVSFQEAATVGNGNTINVLGYKTLLLEVYGTGTGTVEIQGSSLSGQFVPLWGSIIGGNGNAFQVSQKVNITAVPQLYQVDISGLSDVRVPILNISGGNVTVQGEIIV